jgi:hypothetical protein
MSAATASAPKRPPRNRGSIRKREADEPAASGRQPDEEAPGAREDGEDEQSAVVRKAKQARGDVMSFSNKTEKADLVGVKYDGSRQIQKGSDNLATAYLETETQTDRDAR